MTTTTTKPPPRRATTSRVAPRPAGTQDRRLGVAVLVIAACWVLIALYAVHSQLPSNALTLPGQDGMRTSIQIVTPQGWAFFTKSPRSENMIAWRPSDDGRWQAALYAPHAEPRNVFGFNRRSRAQPVELALLANSVPVEHWRECGSGDTPACLASAVAVPVGNPSPHPLVCGPIGLSRQEPLPWAWAGAAESTRMPATVLRLEVRC